MMDLLNSLTIKNYSITSNDFIMNFYLNKTLQQLALSFAQCSSLYYIEFFNIKSLLESNKKTSIYKCTGITYSTKTGRVKSMSFAKY